MIETHVSEKQADAKEIKALLSLVYPARRSEEGEREGYKPFRVAVDLQSLEMIGITHSSFWRMNIVL